MKVKKFDEELLRRRYDGYFEEPYDDVAEAEGFSETEGQNNTTKEQPDNKKSQIDELGSLVLRDTAIFTETK